MQAFLRVDGRVTWPDTDPAGIVWFGVFMRYFENTEEDLFRALGRDRTALLRDLRIFMPRTSLTCSFRSPARLGDEISIGVAVADVSERRVTFAFDVRERGPTGWYARRPTVSRVSTPHHSPHVRFRPNLCRSYGRPFARRRRNSRMSRYLWP